MSAQWDMWNLCKALRERGVRGRGDVCRANTLTWGATRRHALTRTFLAPLPRRYEVQRLSDKRHYALKVTNVQELRNAVAQEVVQEIR